MDGTKEQVKPDVLEEGTIEGVTKRHMMTVEERTELPCFCTHFGRRFSRPQDLKRPENKHEGKCADRKGRMKASERTDLTFECDKCQKHFSRQQDLTRHKQQKCGV